ncbi:unnamed protein product [Peronospora belbahrii]|nr:unnamed protein product [Peronospora belbahrii]
MAQVSHPDLPKHYVQLPAQYPALQKHHAPALGTQSVRALDARQIDLNICPFDGKELYQGLGQCLYRGDIFSCNRSCSHSVRSLPWIDGVWGDKFEHRLAGMAERY